MDKLQEAREIFDRLESWDSWLSLKGVVKALIEYLERERERNNEEG